MKCRQRKAGAEERERRHKHMQNQHNQEYEDEEEKEEAKEDELENMREANRRKHKPAMGEDDRVKAPEPLQDKTSLHTHKMRERRKKTTRRKKTGRRIKTQKLTSETAGQLTSLQHTESVTTLLFRWLGNNCIPLAHYTIHVCIT